jgi:hypothetical protein
MALETAIQGVEALSLQREESRALQPLPHSLPRLVESHNTSPHDVAIGRRDPVWTIDNAPTVTEDTKHITGFLTFAKRLMLRSGAAGLRYALAFFIIAVPLYAILEMQSGSLVTSEVKEFAPTTKKANVEKPIAEAHSPVGQLDRTAAKAQRFVADPQSSGLPLPSVYGVYAISNGQLNELDVLPGRVPDQRVLVSTPISKPSHTILPNGRIVFVVFRRDLTTSAPDRVSVRAVAKLMRGMTFDSTGKASTTTLEDIWTIRNASYEFRVAPLPDNSEMFVFRHEKSDFVFPAGRYALVLKGQGYDFTVAGTITEPAQCVERVEATNGTFYSECRNP